MIHTLAHLILFAASALALMAVVVVAGRAGLSLASVRQGRTEPRLPRPAPGTLARRGRPRRLPGGQLRPAPLLGAGVMTVELKRPMLAAKYDPSKARLPLLGSVKVDGVRCLIRDGVALSRSLKPIPNRHVQAWASEHDMDLNGMDGELVVGELTARDCFRRTSSGVMSRDGEPDFRFLAFDLWTMPEHWYQARYAALSVSASYTPRTELLAQTRLETLEEVEAFARTHEEQGHEGVMLRDPEGLYKQGRATVGQGQLLKLKSFEDGEAVVLGLEEEMHNANEATTNEVGATQRSSHQENMVGKGTLGALRVADVATGVEFHIGTGFSAEERRSIWTEEPLGAVVKYKFFPGGSKDKPRFPVFQGFRHVEDL